MIEITPGPELDLVVAKAIGLEIAGRDEIDDDEVWVVNKDGRTSRWFRPSVDLNDAFAAAEKAGMFLELQRLSSAWMAGTYILGDRIATADTPALAICKAILKLKASPPPSGTHDAL